MKHQRNLNRDFQKMMKVQKKRMKSLLCDRKSLKEIRLLAFLQTKRWFE